MLKKTNKTVETMSLINQEFQKHIKKINSNDFIYKHKIAFIYYQNNNTNFMKDLGLGLN